MKLLRSRIDIPVHELDYALAEYYRNHKELELGKIKYKINKSAGLIYNIQAEILKNYRGEKDDSKPLKESMKGEKAMAEKAIQINNKTELRINTLNNIVVITKDSEEFHITENELDRIYHALRFHRHDYPVDVQ